MKKVLFAIVLTLMTTLGLFATGPVVNPMALSVGTSYFSVNNYTLDKSSTSIDMQASTGFNLNFSYPLSTNWSLYPGFNMNWNKIQSPFKADMTTMVFDFDAKYTFNPGATTQFYVIGGPTYVNAHFGNATDYATGASVGFANTNTLTFNVGGGLQFPLFTPKLKLLVEAKYYYLPQGLMPSGLQGNTGYNAWDAGLMASWKF
jgi:outer membrane protein assembly factor BamA